MAQVSIMATGRANQFWDMEPEAAAEGLAVALHRLTLDGANRSVLPVSYSDMLHAWNVTRPKGGGNG